MKQAIVIAGPNGAGKSTFAAEFLPEEGGTVNFLNADLIAAGLSPFAPEKASMQATRLLLARIEALVERGESFALESTLSGRSHLAHIDAWRKQGYFVVLNFLVLPSVEMAVERVKLRVKRGGHHVPETVARRRYERGLANLPTYKQAVDAWKIWNTSSAEPELIDEGP